MVRVITVSSDALLQQNQKLVYLRKSVNRDKTEWVIVGYQLDLLYKFLFFNDISLLQFDHIMDLIETLKFNSLTGPERGKALQQVRELLETSFGHLPDLSDTLFRKRIDRIIWELVTHIGLDQLKNVLSQSSLQL